MSLQRDGSFYVSDGYCNGRLVRYSAAGEQLASVDVPGMQVAHSVLVDECADTVYVANREAGKVHKVSISTGEVQQAVDVSAQGRAWALLAGPYGQVLALVWELGKPAQLLDVEHPERAWLLPGLEQGYPHDAALGAAALAVSGPGERLFAVYVAPTCPGCKSLQKFVLLPGGFEVPSAEQMLHDAGNATAASGTAPTAAPAGQQASPAPVQQKEEKEQPKDQDEQQQQPSPAQPKAKAASPAPKAKPAAAPGAKNSTKPRAPPGKGKQQLPKPGATNGTAKAAAAAGASPAPAAAHQHGHDHGPAPAAKQQQAAPAPAPAPAPKAAASLSGSPEEFETIVMEPVDDSATAGVAGFVVVGIIAVIVVAGIVAGYQYVVLQQRQPPGPKYIALSTTAPLPVSTSPHAIR